MLITKTRNTNLTALEVGTITDRISRATYDGNLFANATYRNGTLTFTLGVHDSRGKGARRAASGRRLRSACWHAHRDVLAAIFDVAPGVTVRTSLATYKGAESFEDLFPMTANVNAGSLFEPARFADLCECEG